MTCKSSSYGSKKTHCLVVRSTDPFIDDVEHRLLFYSSGEDEGDQSDHGKTSVDDFSLLGQAGLEGREVSERLFVTCDLLLVRFVVRVQQQRVTEWQGADGRQQGDCEEVCVGDQDDGTLVGDHLLVGDSSEGTPVLEVQDHVRVGDEAMSLGVGCADDEEPTEHSMTSVPLLGVDARSPTVLGQRLEFFLPFGSCLLVHFRCYNVQRAKRMPIVYS